MAGEPTLAPYKHIVVHNESELRRQQGYRYKFMAFDYLDNPLPRISGSVNIKPQLLHEMSWEDLEDIKEIIEAVNREHESLKGALYKYYYMGMRKATRPMVYHPMKYTISLKLGRIVDVSSTTRLGNNLEAPLQEAWDISSELYTPVSTPSTATSRP